MTEAKTKTWVQIQNEPIKDLRKRKLQLIASHKIRDDNGLTLLSVTGNQQGGKSSYGMLILSEIYGGDVDQIMKHIVMSANEFVNILEAAITGGYREKCIMWDDLSVEGSAATWMTDPILVKRLGALGDTLGIATKSLIMTSPSGDMIKAFRNYSKYKVIISNGRHKWDRVAKGYWIGKSPMDQRYCTPVFADKYDTRVPFYEIYAQKRKEISLKAVLDMKKSNEEAVAIEQKMTKTERAWEIKRDWKAGVFGDKTLRAVADIVKKTEHISYDLLKAASV